MGATRAPGGTLRRSARAARRPSGRHTARSARRSSRNRREAPGASPRAPADPLDHHQGHRDTHTQVCASPLPTNSASTPTRYRLPLPIRKDFSPTQNNQPHSFSQYLSRQYLPVQNPTHPPRDRCTHPSHVLPFPIALRWAASRSHHAVRDAPAPGECASTTAIAP
jgi:hypothetical protein